MKMSGFRFLSGFVYVLFQVFFFFFSRLFLVFVRFWLAVSSPSKDAKTSVIIMKINKFACRDGPV